MFGELLQTNEYNEKRAPNNGQPLKFALNPAVLLGKIAKFIVFVPIFLYNMITVKKLLS